MAGAISQNPNEMTLEEYVTENLNRFAANDPKRAALQKFYDDNIKGRSLRNQYIRNANPLIKDMFEKASGVKFGELQAQPQQTQMQEPEVVTEARQSFVGSNPNKVTNEVLSKQVNNIQKFDDATAAGQGRNTEAAKQAQGAIRDSRRLINSVKQDGVQDIPVTDPTSDSWATEDSGATGGTADGTGDDSNTNGNTPKESEKSNSLNKLLLADILMTGVRNALHYRPAFRTAYGEDIEGRDFGTEKSLAMKLAEENMKRGLERSNQRKDTQSQTEAEIAATKKKGSDKEYAKAKQNIAIASGTQNVNENKTEVRPWGTTQKQISATKPVDIDQNWNNVRTSN